MRVWRSIFRTPLTPRTERERKRVVLNHLLIHFRPVRLPERTLRYTHTFGLGGMSFVLVLLLILTGILMMFVYEPVPGQAYESVVSLREQVRFGGLVRNIHHWSANLLVLVVFLHLLRTYFTGAFHGARQFNWVIGVLLLLFVLAANFTGYLLPWDQLSYWAITIVTGMLGYFPAIGGWLQRVARGGSEIGGATLINFYTFHTTVIPVTLLALMAFHFWRVRKAGGVVVPYGYDEPTEEKPRSTLFVPDLLLREFVVGLVLVAAVLMFSVFVDARLGDPANPGMSPNPAKAPWYFLGIQELLLHFHPLFAVVMIPAVAVLALLAIPYLRYDSEAAGEWFLTRKGRDMVVVGSVVALVVTPALVILDEYVIDFATWLPGVPPGVANGSVPALLTLGALIGFYFVLKRRYSASNNESIQALFALLAVGFVVLTATGVWLRGPGMALTWPWSG
jgi:quinol-cytochrome oxidoreductase complex cytochrome b subunit